jgi:uncharacterized protein (TIGR03083 family)
MEPMVSLFEQVWSDIDALCGDLTGDEWDRPTDLPGWTVKDNVAHMIGTERMLLGERPDPVDVGEPEHVRNDIGRANEQWIAMYRPRSGRDVLDAFREVTQRRLDALRALTPEEWDAEGFTPEGPGPYRQFMAIRVFDCWYHEQDIREAADRPGGLEGPVADHSIARIPPRGLPYVVGKKVGAPQGTTVVFDVRGEPPLEVAIGVDGRAAVLDTVPRTPTVRLEMDRRTFTRLAGGRWDGARARAEGRLRIEGDAELGERVVDNMGFMI